MKGFLNTQYSRGELEKREFALAPAYKELAKSTGVTKKRVRKAVEGFLALAFPTGKNNGKRGLKMEVSFEVKPPKAKLPKKNNEGD